MDVDGFWCQFSTGDSLEVCDTEGRWLVAEIREIKGSKYNIKVPRSFHISYVGWSDRWNETIPVNTSTVCKCTQVCTVHTHKLAALNTQISYRKIKNNPKKAKKKIKPKSISTLFIGKGNLVNTKINHNINKSNTSKLVELEKQLQEKQNVIEKITNDLLLNKDELLDMKDQLEGTKIELKRFQNRLQIIDGKSNAQNKEIEEMKAVKKRMQNMMASIKEQLLAKDAIIQRNKKTISDMKAKLSQMEEESKESDLEGNFNVKHIKNKKSSNTREESFKSFFYSVIAKSAMKYYDSFVENEFNDLEIMIEFARVEDKNESLEILCNDCGMNRMHARQLLHKLSQLSLDNREFEKWFKTIDMSKYYQMLISSGIATFTMFEDTFVCCADFIQFLGEKNEKQGICIWRNMPSRKDMDENRSMNIEKPTNMIFGGNDEGFEDEGNVNKNISSL